ncbi:hypothetical protein ES332_A13G245800v1 [Gossypium tomentosum]|uniref:Uncharacterized protein n=1 Tax=Gossypium tomentosum TaxID=34277 RepID=A0A5D2MQ83_GOSTO|nr:hypothetical protein ES332_A13G245800v1 [Gossypium tomentosum]
MYADHFKPFFPSFPFKYPSISTKTSSLEIKFARVPFTSS